ncbi:phage integrase central domain-containing protein [Paraburkholderia ginsengiterrae]|uniref:phage integrase central domain-containing protein n=1 Tax=Paraburkholderia ginsengiterrae TaxID=1462993 RepID=UPI003BF77436
MSVRRWVCNDGPISPLPAYPARFQAGATFESVAKSWINAQKAHWSSGYLDKIERRLVKNVYPRLGSRPIAEISTPEYVEIIRYARDRGVMDTARRVRETCNRVFRRTVENSNSPVS